MKFRVSLWLTITLFVMMLSAGIASGCLGYYMGREALKAVTQPDVSSEDPLVKSKPVGGKYKGLKIVNEKAILLKVYNHIHNKDQNRRSHQQVPLKNKANLVERQSEKKINSSLFPLSNQSEGVTLKVENAEFQGGSLLLNLSLKNEGKETVSFLYSFLDVRDDRARPLSAIPDRLPGDLPANGELYSGVLRIPKVLLENTKYISLTMTNYPERTLELKLPQIPISN